MKKEVIKFGEEFIFSNFQESYNFLIKNNHRCEDGFTLAISGSENNKVKVIDVSHKSLSKDMETDEETNSKRSTKYGVITVRTTPTV